MKGAHLPAPRACHIVSLWRARPLFDENVNHRRLTKDFPAWLGHAAEGGAGIYGAAMITVYAIHVLASAAWVGGLPPLLFALVEQRRFGPYDSRERSLEILSRYSLMAMAAVTLIVASRIANAGFPVIGSFDKLFDTSYGVALLTKVAVVAAMLGSRTRHSCPRRGGRPRSHAAAAIMRGKPGYNFIKSAA